MKKYILFFIFILHVSVESFSANYYVSTTGNDSNNGISQNTPFKSIEKGLGVAVTGDFIYVAPGTYTYADGGTLNITRNGINLVGQTGLNGARPLLDFSAMPLLSSNYGIVLSGSNCFVYGIDIKGAGDNGISISGNNNIVEFCSFFENRDTGCQLKGGATNNQIINCDSYNNVDAAQGNADGFAPKLNVGSGTIFRGCRAWQNSDDGWDGYLRPADDVTTTLENCWSFKNGYLKDGSVSQGNGNGYKMGGSDLKDLRHNFILKNCLAFDNRVKGFDQNNNKGSMTLLNCTAINNGTDYAVDGTILATGKTLTVTNCLTPNASSSNVSLKGGIMTTNSWKSPFNCTNADFQSVTITLAQATAPRKSDGSLPDITFMHLKAGSDLIDVGTDVGLPFNGLKPDLGCFETPIVNGVDEMNMNNISMIYPNPTTGKFTVKSRSLGNSQIRVFNSVGNLVEEMPVNSEFSTFDLSIHSSGIYVVQVQEEGKVEQFCIVLQK